MKTGIYIVFLALKLSEAQIQRVYVTQSKSDCPSLPSCYSDIGAALEGVAETKNSQGAEVLIMPGEYNLNQSVIFKGSSVIRIARYDPSVTSGGVQIECGGELGQDAGLTFINCVDISIFGLTFQNCGVLQNSTSLALNDDNVKGYIEFHAAIYVAFCTNFELTHNIIWESKGIAVQLYAIKGDITIEYNQFLDNPYSPNVTKGGGLYIELPYCSPFDYISCISSSNPITPNITVIGASYIISNNNFSRNVAKDDSKSTVFIFPNKTSHDAFGRGGGLSLYLKGNSSNNTFRIESNNFSDNQAGYGGGMLVEYQDNSTHNKVLVNGCTFTSNEATEAGGGVRSSMFIVDGELVHNGIEYTNNIFTNNTAHVGGGVSIEITKEKNTMLSTNYISFTNCHWSKNTARLGSGLDITRSHSSVEDLGVLMNIDLTACEFIDNSVKYNHDRNQNILGYGALYAYSVPITFIDFVTFTGNYDGSALVIIDNTVSFAPNCRATFFANTGRDGAGITIFALSTLIIHKNTSLDFIGNVATNEGGAIYAFRAGGRNLLSSRDCFIRYIDPTVDPDNWLTNITFSYNTASEKPNAIFTTSVYPCLWGREYGPDYDKFTDLARKTFCWKPFHYEPNSCEDDVDKTMITTDAANFTIKSQNLSVVPGRIEMLGITAYNDRGVNVTDFLVLSAHTNAKNQIAIDKRSKYISSNSVILRKNERFDNDSTLFLESLGPRVITADVKINFLPCPPGFVTSNPSGESSSCQCPPSGGFSGLVVCDSRTFKASLLRGFWIGRATECNESKGDVKVGNCKYCFYNVSHRSHIVLKETFCEVEQQLCTQHRQGVLCGNCNDGYGPAINSYDYKCVKCTDKSAVWPWILYIVLRIALPFSLFLLLFVSKFSVASGFLNGPIFFAQVISSVAIEDIAHNHRGSYTLEKIYHALYGIWNLDFCISCFETPCLYPGLRGIHLLLLDYLIAFLPLLLILFFKVMDWFQYFKNKPACHCFPISLLLKSKLLPRLTNQEVIRNGIVASIILSYNKVAVMTGYLLSPTSLYGPSPNDDDRPQKVLYFDGNIDFNSKDHLMFSIPVYICSGIFLLIIPFLLIIYRYDEPEWNGGFFNHLFKLFQEEFRPPDLGRAAHDENETPPQQDQNANQDHRKIEVDHKYKWKPPSCSLRLKVHAYRHAQFRIYTSWGYNEYRWVPGFYLILRLCFVLAYMFADTPMVQLNIQIIISVISAHFFFAFRPYIKSLHNTIDGTIFLLLSVILSLSAYQYYKSVANLHNNLFVPIINDMLILSPLFWITGYIIYIYTGHIIYKIYEQGLILVGRVKRYTLPHCCLSRKDGANSENEKQELISSKRLNDIASINE